MAFSDYWNGPAHRQRADDLDIQLTELQARHAQLLALNKKIGAMDVVEIQELIEQEKARLAAVRNEIHLAEQNRTSLTQCSADLQAQILVWEETLLLESFALYEPKLMLKGASLLTT